MPGSATGEPLWATWAAVERVALPGAPRCAYLREVCGADEESVSSRGTLAAVQLLDRLLADGPGASIRAGEASSLTATERDFLLAHVYRSTFGDRIEGTPACVACGELFDVNFSLDEMIAGILRPHPGVDATSSNIYALAGGRAFRLPTGQDELAVVGLPADEAVRELLRRCVVEGDSAGAEAAVMDAMERAGPVLDLDLQARCPECGAEQSIGFVLQDYLLATLQREGARLLHEVHQLAAAYSWGLTEILSLRRRPRQMLSTLLAGERPQVRP